MEVLIGHGVCHIIAESSVHIPLDEVDAIVKRIGGYHLDYVQFRRWCALTRQRITVAVRQ